MTGNSYVIAWVAIVILLGFSGCMFTAKDMRERIEKLEAGQMQKVAP